MAFRLVEHTADLAIEATGPDRASVLGDAALGLTAVLTGRDDVHGFGAGEERTFFVEAPDPEALVVAFLSELLWLSESEDLLWTGGGVAVGTASDGGLRAEVTGNFVTHDPVRHGRGVEVKAVTYHGLRFAREGAAWRLFVLLDI